MNVPAEHANALKAIIQHIDAGKDFSASDRLPALELLENYECWGPLFALLEREVKDSKKASLDSYLRLARIQYLYLEDVFAASEACALAVVNLRLSYRDLIEKILPSIFEHDDYPAEATLIQAVSDKFKEKADCVSALERLCLLYEKKTFNEHLLNESYTALLNLDPLNPKALRYFKVLFTQNYEWEKVISVLRNLIKASKHPRDVFRVAQELAAVLLYQMDQPQEAISVIDTYCEGSPLDTSTIHYDAYQRLGDTEGCLKVLRECLLSVSDEQQLSVIHFRIGQLLEKLKRPDEAELEYKKSCSLNRMFFEAYENLISIKLQSKQWQAALGYINELYQVLDDQSAKTELEEARNRLIQGMKHGT